MGRHANVLDQAPIGRARATCENLSSLARKNRKNLRYEKLHPDTYPKRTARRVDAKGIQRVYRSSSSRAGGKVKSAFYVSSSDAEHYAKVHALLTDHSPLQVSIFTELAAAAKWLGVPVELLMAKA